ncbi:D-serine ammonia-lyase [Aestuariimicrobium sp. Y1814]|uniref:D-serine ammonia-lyase n=1 Tax=Aestuariimicrobium sp. Y1814 TaxID=3418742 RepID=UPI003DA72495
MSETILGKPLTDWVAEFPLIAPMRELQELTWFNPAVKATADALPEVGLTVADIDDAAARLKRFAPYLVDVFPETGRSAGILESPLVGVPAAQQRLAQHFGADLPGKLWAKLDSQLPISGSIKARGGIYEVLQHAESLALEAGLITLDDDYRKLNTDQAREFFGQYKVAVGSTGNLGLSIGIMSAQLGFQASVHMSSDARQWKKDRLRSHGVTVVEYESDYSVAVAQGREEAKRDPMAYFVDDENSKSLFVGYAVAGRRLAGQFQSLDVTVDERHPLFVYLPCGVGGGPGGVAFGLKSVFGDNVHCIFSEPTHSPCMMLGVYTGQHDAVSVQDFGIDNVTAADGLAVGRASGFVGTAMQHLLDGYLSVDDDELYRIIAILKQTEDLEIEPSAAAGFPGPWRVLADAEYRDRFGFDEATMARATHLAWATGGGMVPPAEMASYIAKGTELLG